MSRITANTMLPAKRRPISVQTADGETLVGELALPSQMEPIATLVCLHPLSTDGGSSDSHLFRKAAWRLPALTGIAVLRFNFRSVTSSLGSSTGSFDSCRAEGLDLGAMLAYVTREHLPEPWLLGWSFGTDVTLKYGNRDPVVGAILLAPPLRWSTATDLARWAETGRPLSALIPEYDDYLRPAEAVERFAAIPQAQVVPVPDGRHLFVGEKYVRIVLDHVVEQIAPAYAPLPTQWSGPVQSWSLW